MSDWKKRLLEKLKKNVCLKDPEELSDNQQLVLTVPWNNFRNAMEISGFLFRIDSVICVPERDFWQLAIRGDDNGGRQI